MNCPYMIGYSAVIKDNPCDCPFSATTRSEHHQADDGNQVSGGPVAAGLDFGGLDKRIDRLDTAVGEPGIERIEEAWPVILKRLGHRFDRLQAATARPAVPSVEERLGLRRAPSVVEDLA